MDKNKIYYDKLFPNLSKTETVFNEIKAKLKIDTESISYISTPFFAEKITKIIIELSKQYLNKESKDIVITDCTAGCGGDTISFCKAFQFVNAFEIDEKRCMFLENNLETYQLYNNNIFNCDFRDLIEYMSERIKQDVIFIDPPWGKEYYNKKMYTIEVGTSATLEHKTRLEDICNDILKKRLSKILVLKLPKNYDIQFFYENVKSSDRKLVLYDLKKMLILAVVCV